MKTDIQSRENIEKLVDAFYAKATKDEIIGPFFTTIIPINWDQHLPIMCQFWENAIFHTGGYRGNMMEVHQKVHQIIPILPSHFHHWADIFCETVDSLFEGEKAEQAKQHARNMALMLEIKING
jgi:hemoglobin